MGSRCRQLRCRFSGLAFFAFVMAPLLLAACGGTPTSPPSFPTGPTAEASDSFPGAPALAIGDGTEPLWSSVSKFFSPVVYQFYGNDRDHLSQVTYDGDWDALNNWNNVYAYPKFGRLYISMSEDANRYFIYYGTFHPRDWCTFPDFPEVCAPPYVGLPFEHENDMEGAMVVVDKRFTTPTYPYGQIVTITTVFHDSHRIYQNCNLEGGYPLYVQPDGVWKTAWSGCIVYTPSSALPFQPAPVPPQRFNLVIEKKGHGNYISSVPSFASTSPPFYIRYHNDYPSAPQGGDANYWVSNLWATYSMIWLNQAELVGKSLWSGRFQGLSQPYALIGAIGPGNQNYYYRFGGNEGNNNVANAPWGLDLDGSTLSTTVRGDFHNHPAWTWSQHFAPLPATGNTYYEYCRLATCKLNNSYIDNIYFDLPAGGGGGGGPGCAPNCTAPPIETTALETVQSDPALRWEFARGSEGVGVSGSGLVAADTLTDADTEWGYATGTASLLRLRGSGTAVIRLPTDGGLASYQQAVVRLRRPVGAAGGPKLRWNDTAGGSTANRSRDIPLKYRKGAWEVVVLDLATDPDWRAARAAQWVELEIDLGPVATGVVDIDFIVIAP